MTFTSNGTTVITTPNNSILTGQWYHIVVTRTSAATAPANIYINGVLSVSGNTATAGPTGTTDVIIGNNSAGSLTFDGRISDVRIYNRALSAAEISAIYNATR